ncbi:hypothetical protein L6164_020527 [Bauhinia variegata]|uniref:Uncharacterized protein n=1 Tax=Bauhinia variegata TaxID=167791 RepID=A0ACB9MVT8_BAUVA|nr:hypothetical protein L6164_020527 [Bauhinia variegata]
MELCTLKAISKLHNPPPPLASASSHCYLLPPKPSVCLRQIPITRTAGLLSRPIYLSNLLPRATASEESSGGPSWYIDKKEDEKRDGGIITGDAPTADKKTFNETVTFEETKDESPVDEQVQPFAFLDNLNIKFDTDDTTSILLYGGGAIAALWLTSAVVSAIDSIPLFPKFLEVVGLAYTLWFTYRYLLFKQNRDELAAKIEELKEQVLGSDDDD